ncbi:MAG: metallophosphoesterase [Defluviitaleaceae bacterium]|nr:metallophosphoesterase [Defluviitaleaceae bacterium]
MKILVLSDTHERTSELESLLARYANEVNLVCHLGDHAWDLMRFSSQYPDLSMVAVAGNCDYGNVEPERILAFKPCLDSGEQAVTRILLNHGHNLGVKNGVDRLCYYAREKGANACFFGHTHMPVCTTVGGVFVMNPGSPVLPRGGSEASYGIVEVSPEGKITGQIHLYGGLQ